MDPTTSGRFRVHDRRPRPDIEDDPDADVADLDTDTADASEEFVLVELPEGPVDPTAPDAEEQFDPLYATAEGYEDELAERVASLKPGYVVDATLAWTDGSARFDEVEVVRESRFRFADGVEGMFEAAVETWEQIRAAGEAVGSITTRSNDGEPNGALYLFADAPGGDAFADLRAGRLPVEPLIARVNESREDDDPREVFVLRPAAHEFVAVYVVFDRDGVLAQTVRDTYDLGPGLAAGLEAGEFEAAKADDGGTLDGGVSEGGDASDDSDDSNDSDDFDALDRL
ncbi:DUF6663 family protein [Halorubrum sp. CBA1229]|uniref:DUF6663 family protein n=1 Tax=Halorubrum sp. CBA1229 TaxID=1853699 RepID=UPI000F3AD453|nr:DUF6663 family protein [Halorubrum sp. CBA1229]QKY16183.1 hypothetical protein Hrr1229_004550 [Halorubrum sp. CBA1229]